MPRAPNLRSQSKGAVTNVVEAAKELSTNLHAANMAKLLDEGDNNVLMPHLAKYLHSFDVLFSSSGRIALNATQLSDLTHGLLEADIPHSLLDCLKTITPLSLIAPAWCSDPSCGDGQCGPPSSTPIILMVLNQTLSVVSQAPDEARDLFFKTLVDAGLAPALLDLVDAASTAIRVGPRDIMAVIGSDHALATVLDALSFLRIWIQRHGHEEIEDGSTHYCIDLLIQMEAIQIVPRAIALHESLTKVIGLFRGTISLRTMGTDASILQLVGLYAMCGRNYPETGIEALSSSLYPDVILRAIVRSALKMGAKVPQSAYTLGLEPNPSGTPPPALQPHWGDYDLCTSIILQAVIGAQGLIKTFSETLLDDDEDDEESLEEREAAAMQRSMSIKGLASLEGALVTMSVIKHLIASKLDPSRPKGDSCSGCALTMLSLQAANLLSQIVLLLPRDMAIKGGLAEEATSLLVVLQIKAMGRASNLRSAQPVAVEECENGEVDWVIADLMLAIHLYLVGGSPSLLDERVPRTHQVSGSNPANHQSLLSHHHFLHDTSEYAEANGTRSIHKGRESLGAIPTLPNPWAHASAVRLFRVLEGLLRVQAAPLDSPTSHQPLIRVAHLTALDLAAAILSRAPESLLASGRDFGSFSATVKKLTASIVRKPDGASSRTNLTPNFACELILKVAKLLQATLDALPLIGPLASHVDSISSGTFRILCSLHLLVSHLSTCRSVEAASSSQFCSEAVVEALSVISRLCISLLKTPLPPSLVLRSDLQRVSSNLLSDILRVSNGVDPYCPQKKGNTPPAAGPHSLKRALVWSGALAFLQALMIADQLPNGVITEPELRSSAAQSIAPLNLASSSGEGSEAVVLCSASISGAAFIERSIASPLPQQLESALQRAKAGLVDEGGEEKGHQAAVDKWASMVAVPSEPTSPEDAQALAKLLVDARTSILSWSCKSFHEEFAQHPSIQAMPRSRLDIESPSSPGLTRMERIISNLGEGGLLKLAQIIQAAAPNALSSSPDPAWLQLLREEGSRDGLLGSRLVFSLRLLAARERGDDAASGLSLSELMGRLGEGVDARGGQGEVQWIDQWAGLYSTLASRGLFVGCCNPGCLNLDRMSESQLALSEEDGRGMLCVGCLGPALKETPGSLA